MHGHLSTIAIVCILISFILKSKLHWLLSAFLFHVWKTFIHENGVVSWHWDKLCTHTWLSLVVVVPKLIYWLNFLNQLIIIKLIYHTKQYSTASNKNICFLSVSFLFPNFIITVFSKHLWSHVHISMWYVFILSR